MSKVFMCYIFNFYAVYGNVVSCLDSLCKQIIKKYAFSNFNCTMLASN